jgi:LysR family glycine cleavage system transcriptional activator
VSQHISGLERRLGFRLFKSLPRSVELTDVGIAYLPTIRKAFEDIAAVTVGMFGRSTSRR